jgi:hypothetical protein
VAASIALHVSGIVTTPYASERTSLDVRTSSTSASTIAHGGQPFSRAIRSTHDANDSLDVGATTNASRPRPDHHHPPSRASSCRTRAC